jgi:S-DNA-T family DNA segregation ATPase FtsK/SpoIIIE
MVSLGRRAGVMSVMSWTGRLWSGVALARARGGLVAAIGAVLALDLAAYRSGEASLDTAAAGPSGHPLGPVGADIADLALQTLGLGAAVIALLALVSGLATAAASRPGGRGRPGFRAAAVVLGIAALTGALAAPAPPASWPLAAGLGGMVGDTLLSLASGALSQAAAPAPRWLACGLLALTSAAALAFAWGTGRRRDAAPDTAAPRSPISTASAVPPASRRPAPSRPALVRKTSADDARAAGGARAAPPEASPAAQASGPAIKPPKATIRPSGREEREIQAAFDFDEPRFRLPELAMLTKPKPRASAYDEEALRQNARMLETVLGEFGVRGQIDHIRPGPVVTLYELVPAAGVKSARVVALSDDIARSMSVAACRVSVVPFRNALGIELPNARRETVYLRDLLASAEYEKASQTLPLALGETIGGEPYIADLAKMPHLLIAGTTGSGKSVGVNAMILSILYRLPPEICRFIMIDPKMLELSVYDGIPHLLAPVVTDPKKAIVALKWTVREMEDRYRRMSKIGVRNVAGFNDRAREAIAKGEHFVRTVQTGFDGDGQPVFEEEKLRPEPMPYLVVVIDEVADLMMVAGKDIEGAVQRLAQMARAAGIHLIMATQRPSVDVITGTIKANFPTRISFQVTSKIDSRTIMGEQGAEQLLGMGDMLYMAGGGKITRLHGPYVDDEEVIKVATYLRDQGEPQYLEDVTAAVDGDEDEAPGGGEGMASNDLYDQAVAVVTRDRKASTSYIQRRLQIGYNRAASLIERMEREGVVSVANHAGKREILAGPPP